MSKTTVHVESLIARRGVNAIGLCIVRDTGRALDVLEIERIMGGLEYVNSKGKVAKRIRRNLKRELEITLSDNAVAEIGNIAHQYTLKAGDYAIEVTDDILGTVGRFGDARSCYREGSDKPHHARAMQEDGRFCAVRIYKSNGDPLARAWAYLQDGAHIVFNAYGMTLYKIAKILSIADGNAPFKRIVLNSDLWVNGGDDQGNYGKGYIVGPGERFNIYSIHVGVGDKPSENCYQCGLPLTDWDTYHRDRDGDPWCAECWGVNRARCHYCRAPQPDGGTTVHCQGGDITTCPSCADSHYNRCMDCGEYGDGSRVRVHPVGRLCIDCANQYSQCDGCGKILAAEDGNGTCSYCEYVRSGLCTCDTCLEQAGLLPENNTF